MLAGEAGQSEDGAPELTSGADGAGYAELLREAATGGAPRVFALVEEFADHAEFYAWGVEVGERASVFTEDGRAFAHCSSAVDAHDMFSLIRPVRLVWPTSSDIRPRSVDPG